jgi:hypothetical protein
MLAGRFVVAGAHPSPRREMRGVGEDRHVHADLGNDDFCVGMCDAGNGAEPVALARVGLHRPTDLLVESGGDLPEVVVVAE